MRFARFDDYAQIARLERANNLEVRDESDWKNLWLANPVWPRVKDRWPIGWVYETPAGEIVGSIISIPSLYSMNGRELICANGRSWVCAPEYRGFAIMLMDEYLNFEGADLFINTTVGPFSVQSQDELAARVPIADWQTAAYFITHYHGFARNVLQRKKIPMAGLLSIGAGGALRLRDFYRNKKLPAAPTGITIESVSSFDSRFDSFWQKLRFAKPDTLLACRDRAALEWHFDLPLRRNRLRILTASRGDSLLAWCILKRHDQAGGIHRMRLVDYQSIEPEIDLLPAMLGAAKKLCAAESIDILDHLGVGLPQMRAFDLHAPYRHDLGVWTFYYRSNNPELSAQLAQPERWSPSFFDGDASYE
jgi:hypothetical protein